jgi:hypothetical protein
MAEGKGEGPSTKRRLVSGCVSLSYDGDPRASYAEIDDAGITIRRVSYDVEEEVGRLLADGYPQAAWLAKILRTGRYVPPGD